MVYLNSGVIVQNLKKSGRLLVCVLFDLFEGDDSDKTLSSRDRDRNPDHVSLPPHLRTIQEQKTLEDSETVEYDQMSPSPIRAFNEGRRIRQDRRREHSRSKICRRYLGSIDLRLH